VKLAEGLRARWHAGAAYVLSDYDPCERQHRLADQVPSSVANANREGAMHQAPF